MKPSIVKSLFFTMCLCFSQATIAYIECPPTPLIAEQQFVKAEGAAGIWDLFAKKLQYKNRNWQLIFTVYLPDAHTQTEAIVLGTDFYRMYITLFDPPMARESNERQTCYYAQQESSYFVRAISTNE